MPSRSLEGGMPTSSQQIRRLSTTSGGVISRGPGGQGTKHVVIPPPPDPPSGLSEKDKAEWRSAWKSWCASLQAQFPIP